MNDQQSLLIYDISPELVKALLPDQSGYKIIDANASAAFCRGCFGCWLKTPGCCVIKDRLQTIAAQIGCCKEVIILSLCCYGGFSPGVKRVLDRAIAVSLPFFTYRGGRVYHICRYKNHPTLRICFYGVQSNFERDTAIRLAEANRINQGFSAIEIFFAVDAEHIREVMRL